MTKLFILLFTLHSVTHAYEACSRIAVINQQEILVDPSTSRKGEGLRNYLQKDKVANDLLDRYQSIKSNRIRTAVLGTTGTGLMLSAFIANNSDNNKKALLIGGASLLIVNFLLAKTVDANNEQYFERAIEEYNKRNLPKIFLKSDQEGGIEPGVIMNKDWSF